MITLLKLLLDRCGLSHQEAADILGVRLDSLKAAASGRRPTPSGWVDELRDLHEKIEIAADELLAAVAEKGPTELLLYVAPTDADARKRGWPCVSAMAAAVGRAAALTDLPVIVTHEPIPKAH